jgi:hypothetical protein
MKTEEPKIAPSDFRRQADAMVATGTLPSLETVLKVVAEVRAKYIPLILAARKENP